MNVNPIIRSLNSRKHPKNGKSSPAFKKKSRKRNSRQYETDSTTDDANREHEAELDTLQCLHRLNTTLASQGIRFQSAEDTELNSKFWELIEVESGEVIKTINGEQMYSLFKKIAFEDSSTEDLTGEVMSITV